MQNATPSDGVEVLVVKATCFPINARKPQGPGLRIQTPPFCLYSFLCLLVLFSLSPTALSMVHGSPPNFPPYSRGCMLAFACFPTKWLHLNLKDDNINMSTPFLTHLPAVNFLAPSTYCPIFFECQPRNLVH
ncbi:hypothetical protein ES332_A03G183500v1 [Gossypium tomentosum]|uniref:Uncharacterized protein n=1 Tax=Gossypium tomentosum TaxID=34277 RepID=A0A5D2RBT9_GOSTO|nr:hypothetical protein ES332_A03G183500v1 [Gossypium tomentosum]